MGDEEGEERERRGRGRRVRGRVGERGREDLKITEGQRYIPSLVAVIGSFA